MNKKNKKKGKQLRWRITQHWVQQSPPNSPLFGIIGNITALYARCEHHSSGVYKHVLIGVVINSNTIQGGASYIFCTDQRSYHGGSYTTTKAAKQKLREDYRRFTEYNKFDERWPR